MPWMRWPLCLLLLTAAVPGMAQPPRGQPAPSTKEYRPLPYSGSLVDIYKDQLLQAKDTEFLKKLMELANQDPKALQKLLENHKLKAGDPSAVDPELLKLLQNSDGTSKSPDELKDLLKKLQDQVTPNKAPEPKAKPKVPTPDGTTTHHEQRPDPLAKIAEAFVKKMDKSSLPDKFPAFNKFKDDVMAGKTGTASKGDLGSLGLEDVLDVLGKSSKTNGDGPSLPQAGPLEIPGGAGGMPDVPTAPLVPDLSGIAGAAGGLTTTSVAGGGLALVQILLILAVFVVAAILVWRLLGRSRQHEPQVALATLGPWPVDPARISTRAQLVQAFEYLAMLLLGRPARTANHRAIADSLGTTPETGQAADQLASLYEKARYDPVLGELPPADLTAARRDLLLLAGHRAPASGEG